jgi:uncharacterized protein
MLHNSSRPLWDLVQGSRVEIRNVARRHHARHISVFGSVARGEETDQSDIDFLVEFEPKSSLLDLLHLQDDLSGLLRQPVDVVSAGGLRPRDNHIREESVQV